MNSRDKLMMEISKRLEAIRDAEMQYPQQFTLRALACAVIKTVADAEGKSIEEVLEDIEGILYMYEGGEANEQ